LLWEYIERVLRQHKALRGTIFYQEVLLEYLWRIHKQTVQVRAVSGVILSGGDKWSYMVKFGACLYLLFYLQ
jgi:hypothetical protein